MSLLVQKSPPGGVSVRGEKSGRFREFNLQKIFLKTRFDRKYLGSLPGIGSFANPNSSVMVNSNLTLKRMLFSFVFLLYLRLKLVETGRKYLSMMPDSQKEKYFFHLCLR